MHNSLTALLTQVRDGSISVADAALQLREAPFEDLGYARVDHHRRLRQGAAEVIYGAGKTPEQIISLIERCILLLFPACDPEVFHIYERIIRYIQKQY